jgi:L-threonylcarbamoyladenylate synthase
MEIVAINSEKPEPGTIALASGHIKKGFAVVVPTDTLYALSVNALDETALARLFRIKRRPPTKAVPIFVKDMAMARKLAYISDDVQRKLETLWPGPVTVVLYKKDIVPALAAGGGETIALRMPAHNVVRELIRAIDAPLTGTSANISGLEPTNDPEAVCAQFAGATAQPDLVLHVGVLPPANPSTVIDLTEGRPRLLRMGPITKRDLEKLWSKQQ